MIRETFCLVSFFAFMGFVGHMYAQDAEHSVMEQYKAREKKLELLSFPLAWDFSSTQCDTKKGCRTRFWKRKEQK